MPDKTGKERTSPLFSPLFIAFVSPSFIEGRCPAKATKLLNPGRSQTAVVPLPNVTLVLNLPKCVFTQP